MYVPMLLSGGLHIEMTRRWSMEGEGSCGETTEQILTDHESAREEGL